jgi:uncharacterized protein YjbJ (UPF0337 family)
LEPKKETIKGSIKEVVGKTAGNAKLEAEGKADKVEGNVQNAVGGLKDKATSQRRCRRDFGWNLFLARSPAWRGYPIMRRGQSLDRKTFR